MKKSDSSEEADGSSSMSAEKQMTKRSPPSRKDTGEVNKYRKLHTPPKRFMFSQGHRTE